MVPPGSPSSFAQALLTLLGNDDLRHRLAAAARARALEFFTIDGAISRFDEIYSFLAAGQQLPVVPPEPGTEDPAEDLPDDEPEDQPDNVRRFEAVV